MPYSNGTKDDITDTPEAFSVKSSVQNNYTLQYDTSFDIAVFRSEIKGVCTKFVHPVQSNFRTGKIFFRNIEKLF